MTTQSIGSSGYTDTYARLRASVEEDKLYANARKADQETAQSGNTTMNKEIMSYLSEIPKGEDNKLSFQDVDDYRTKLETEWDVSVMADLEKLGVDITKQFPLTYDPTTNKVTVNGEHPDKTAVDQYFENNPDKVKEFEKIIQLGKLTSVANSQLSQTEMTSSLQQQSIAWWFEDNSDPTTWFASGGMLTGNNSSSYTGLNLTV